MSALDWVLPRFCCACDARVVGRRPELGLCLRCRAWLVAIDPCASCPTCGRSLPRERDAPAPCGSCRLAPPSFARLVAAFEYRPPLSIAVCAFKYARHELLARDFAAAIAQRLRTLDEPLDLVVPVPIHWRRRSLRGFHPAGALAEALAHELDLPRTQALRRRRHEASQTRSDRRQRLRQLRGAFTPTGRDVAGTAIVLVDDVFTTGATATAAATALLAAGAARVVVAVVAATPAS